MAVGVGYDFQLLRTKYCQIVNNHLHNYYYNFLSIIDRFNVCDKNISCFLE